MSIAEIVAGPLGRINYDFDGRSITLPNGQDYVDWHFFLAQYKRNHSNFDFIIGIPHNGEINLYAVGTTSLHNVGQYTGISPSQYVRYFGKAKNESSLFDLFANVVKSVSSRYDDICRITPNVKKSLIRDVVLLSLFSQYLR
jgi:hypothetical protein